MATTIVPRAVAQNNTLLRANYDSANKRAPRNGKIEELYIDVARPK